MNPVSNAPKVMKDEVKLIAAENLVPFKRHRFSLYEGERLDDMVESIKKKRSYSADHCSSNRRDRQIRDNQRS